MRSRGSEARPFVSAIFPRMLIPSLFMLGGLVLLAAGAEGLVRGRIWLDASFPEGGRLPA